MSLSSGPARSRRPAPPVPLSVLTGFLGAGKTTLLNRLLKDPSLGDTAVIINEFGEIGLDHLLVEHVEDGVVLLQSGCLCCTLRGDLVRALETLLRGLDNGRMQFRRVILETTGLADPAPVLQTVMAHPYLVMRYRLDGVITVVDAMHGLTTLDQHSEAVKQAAVADRIVITKRDLVDSATSQDAHNELHARLRALNPAAPILDAAEGQTTPAAILDCGLYNPDGKSPDVRRWLAEEAHAAARDHGPADHREPHRHDDRVRSLTLSAAAPIPAAAFDMFIELLRSVHGANLLRLKGIVNIAEEPDRPLVMHGVQHVFHPPAYLEGWPDGDRRTRIVVITRDLDPHVLSHLFRSLTNTPAPDQPDRAALVDNPLVPFAGVDR